AGISITANGYDVVNASGTVVAGNTLWFSPSMYLTGSTPTGSVDVFGTIADAQTRGAVANALVSVIGTNQSTTSGSDGAFLLTDVTPGVLTLNLSANAYQTVDLEVLTPGSGAVNLNTIYLALADGLPTTTIIGRVIDAQTNTAISGATVTLDGVSSLLTSDDGSFQFDDVVTSGIELNAGAAGYLSATRLISFVEPTVIFVEIALASAFVDGISITGFSADRGTGPYEAVEEVNFSAIIANNSTVTRRLNVFAVISDAAGNLIDRIAVTRDSMDPEPPPEPEEEGDASASPEPFELDPNSTKNIFGFWNTERNVPGDYEIKLQAFNAASGQLVAERAIFVSIQATENITDIEPIVNPRFTGVGSTQQVSINLSLLNVSNVPVGASAFYTMFDPSNQVVRTGQVEFNLQPTETLKLVPVDEFDLTFNQSGEYRLEARVSWPLISPVNEETFITGISVAPNIRIEASQEVSPQTVLPDTDNLIRIKIRLEGVDAEQQP
ncbi:MAG: carboxypeptidase regulatory-like domain-containing protein, partial [Gammaproteobacteria bacterium]|nr:carboxypeptidase regulatory-like domain-containing protein [Gammaproteobacteria bacterium]